MRIYIVHASPGRDIELRTCDDFSLLYAIDGFLSPYTNIVLLNTHPASLYAKTGFLWPYTNDVLLWVNRLRELERIKTTLNPEMLKNGFSANDAVHFKFVVF